MLNENSRAADAIHSGAILRPELLDKLEAPAFIFDARCIGPDAKNRAEYLALLHAAECAERSQWFERAREIRAEAEKLLNLQWEEKVHNTVMIPGKNDILNQYFKGSAYTAAWYLLLVGGSGTIANTDTLASHAGWTEQTPYSGNRPAITFGTTSGGSNTATAVSITINATATVTGAGISSVNSGSSGILYSASNFAASRSVASGDTLNVTPTVSVS